MDFRILGTLEVRGDGGLPVMIRQPRQRHLLTVLLLHANRPLGVHELITELWDSPCDDSRVGALRTHIWALRRLLTPADRLGKQVRGYLFTVLPGELDLHTFRLLAEQGRRAMAEHRYHEAAGILARAIAIWSDPPLADLPMTPAADIAARRLTGERDALRELLTDAKMALGQHRDLVPELEAQVAADPVNEQKWAQFLLALYRSGQQVRALGAYGQVRHLLAAEYGVDPGPGLRRLHLQILRADPALDPPQGVGASVLSPGPVVRRGPASWLSAAQGRPGWLARLPGRPRDHLFPGIFPRRGSGTMPDAQIQSQRLSGRQPYPATL